jgi:hypothetical protein
MDIKVLVNDPRQELVVPPYVLGRRAINIPAGVFNRNAQKWEKGAEIFRELFWKEPNFGSLMLTPHVELSAKYYSPRALKSIIQLEGYQGGYENVYLRDPFYKWLHNPLDMSQKLMGDDAGNMEIPLIYLRWGGDPGRSGGARFPLAGLGSFQTDPEFWEKMDDGGNPIDDSPNWVVGAFTDKPLYQNEGFTIQFQEEQNAFQQAQTFAVVGFGAEMRGSRILPAGALKIGTNGVSLWVVYVDEMGGQRLKKVLQIGVGLQNTENGRMMSVTVLPILKKYLAVYVNEFFIGYTPAFRRTGDAKGAQVGGGVFEVLREPEATPDGLWRILKPGHLVLHFHKFSPAMAFVASVVRYRGTSGLPLQFTTAPELLGQPAYAKPEVRNEWQRYVVNRGQVKFEIKNIEDGDFRVLPDPNADKEYVVKVGLAPGNADGSERGQAVYSPEVTYLEVRRKADEVLVERTPTDLSASWKEIDGLTLNWEHEKGNVNVKLIPTPQSKSLIGKASLPLAIELRHPTNGLWYRVFEGYTTEIRASLGTRLPIVELEGTDGWGRLDEMVVKDSVLGDEAKLWEYLVWILEMAGWSRARNICYLGANEARGLKDVRVNVPIRPEDFAVKATLYDSLGDALRMGLEKWGDVRLMQTYGHPNFWSIDGIESGSHSRTPSNNPFRPDERVWLIYVEPPMEREEDIVKLSKIANFWFVLHPEKPRDYYGDEARWTYWENPSDDNERGYRLFGWNLERHVMPPEFNALTVSAVVGSGEAGEREEVVVEVNNASVTDPAHRDYIGRLKEAFLPGSVLGLSRVEDAVIVAKRLMREAGRSQEYAVFDGEWLPDIEPGFRVALFGRKYSEPEDRLVKYGEYWIENVEVNITQKEAKGWRAKYTCRRIGNGQAFVEVPLVDRAGVVL